MTPDSGINFKAVRSELGLSQVELADLIGVSQRTVQSCEQGWRKPGPAVEKAVILLLMASRQGADFGIKACWNSINCSRRERDDCLVYQSRQGHLCWLLSGNTCQGRSCRTWEDKKAMCGECSFFRELLPSGLPTT